MPGPNQQPFYPDYQQGAPSLLAQQAAAYGGPQAAPAIQRSIYLSHAIDALGTAGSNLRSGGALAANLMADAIDQFSRNRNDQQLQQLAQGGMQRQLTADPIAGVDPATAGASGSPATPQAGQGGGLFGGLAHLLGLGGSPQSQPQPNGNGAGAQLTAAWNNAAGLPGGSPQPQPNPNAAGPGVPTSVSAPSPQPGGAPSAPNPKAAAEPASAPIPAPASSPAAAGQGQGGDPLLAHVIQHFTSEGYSPAAAAGMAGNFAAESNLSPTSVNPKEGAFGIANWTGSRRAALQQFAQANGRNPADLDTQLAFADSELAGPERRARDLLMNAQTPAQGAAAALAYERPAGYHAGGDPAQASRWGVRLGNTESAFAQSQGPTAPQSSATASQSTPVPRPVQVSTGPDPTGPTQGAVGPTGASPVAVAGQQAGPQPSGFTAQQNGFTAQPVPLSPAQIQRYQALESMAAKDPRYLQPLVDYRNALHQQLSTPEELAQTRPNDAGQITVTGKSSGRLYGVVSPQGIQIAAGPKMVSDGNGGWKPVQGTGISQVPGAQPGTLLQHNDATGELSSAPIAGAFTPKDMAERLSALQGSDQYKAADNAVNMYTAATQAATRPGGISDVELRDFAARQFSGGVARQFNVEALNNAQGAWANLRQFAPQLISGQHMSPEARQALLQAMHDDASLAQTSFGHLANSNEALANSQGLSLRPFLAPLARDLPPIPSLGSIPNGMPAPGSPPQGAQSSPVAQQQTQIMAEAHAAIAQGAPRAAVIQRLQSMGINPAGL